MTLDTPPPTPVPTLTPTPTPTSPPDPAAAPRQADPANLDTLLGATASNPWRKRAIWAAIAVAALVGAWYAYKAFSGDPAVAYATQDARRGALTVIVSATGNLQPTNEVEVGSEQSGIVIEVGVDNNDRVVRGQAIARLDTARLRDALTQNEAAVASAVALVAQAQASEAQAHANLARLEEVYRLSGGKVPSRTELDTGRAEARRNAAAVRSAQAQVTQARAQLATARTNLSKATIYSPVTGVVLSRKIDPGQTVAASFTAPVLFTIAEDLARMKLEVKVDEADVGRVKAGQRATFIVDAFPGRVFPATITRVDVGANASGDAATTTASTVIAYTAFLEVSNTDLALRPGMTATANIVVSEEANQMLVPNAALRFRPATTTASAAPAGGGGVASVLVPSRPGGGGGGAKGAATAATGRGSRGTIYILDADGNPKAIQVTTLDSNETETAVTGDGLKAGMKVITGTLAPPA